MELVDNNLRSNVQNSNHSDPKSTPKSSGSSPQTAFQILNPNSEVLLSGLQSNYISLDTLSPSPSSVIDLNLTKCLHPIKTSQAHPQPSNYPLDQETDPFQVDSFSSQTRDSGFESKELTSHFNSKSTDSSFTSEVRDSVVSNSNMPFLGRKVLNSNSRPSSPLGQNLANSKFNISRTNSEDGTPKYSSEMATGYNSSDSERESSIEIIEMKNVSKRPFFVTFWRALIYVLLWYTFSMCLSLYNKFLLGVKHGSFPAPLLLTTTHFILQFVISVFLLKFFCVSWRPSVYLTWNEYLQKIVPTGISTALDIGLSNLSMALITLTFYTMCKSSSPVFLLLFAFAFRIETPSFRLLGIIILISIGILFTVAGETQFELIGFILAMCAALISGLRWVLIQVLLHKERQASGLTNPLVTLAYLTPVMTILCGSLSAIYEPWDKLAQTRYFDTWEHIGVSLIILGFGGCLAFCMITSEFLLISETSALTFTIVGTIKEVVTILVSHLVFGDQFTKVNLTGLFIIIFGVTLFNMYKHKKSLEEKSNTLHTSASMSSLDSKSKEEKQELLKFSNVDVEENLNTSSIPRSNSYGDYSRMHSTRKATFDASMSPRISSFVKGSGEMDVMLGTGSVVSLEEEIWKSPKATVSPRIISSPRSDGFS